MILTRLRIFPRYSSNTFSKLVSSIHPIRNNNNNNNIIRLLSSTPTQPPSHHHDKDTNTLYIFLNNEKEQRIPTRILTPVANLIGNIHHSSSEEVVVVTPQQSSLVNIIEEHYQHDEQFVGGMGEQDGGVWFVPQNVGDDPLMCWEMIRDTIQTIKEHRHGIPFGVYTSGIVHLFPNPSIPSILQSEIGLTACEVTLGGAYDPMSYKSSLLSNDDDNDGDNDASKCFGSVCQFIVEAAESGFPMIRVGTNGNRMAADLALSLGAIDVVAYSDQKKEG